MPKVEMVFENNLDMFRMYSVCRQLTNYWYAFLEKTDGCQKGCKRKSGVPEAEVEEAEEKNIEKKAKLDDSEEDPATAEPQFAEA